MGLAGLVAGCSWFYFEHTVRFGYHDARTKDDDARKDPPPPATPP